MNRAQQRTETFVGRSEQLELLEAALDAAAGGNGQVVLISGEPGVGKSYLTQRFLRGRHAALGQCHAGIGAPALWPWLEALQLADTYTDDPGDAAPGSAGQPFSASKRFALFLRLEHRIEQAADRSDGPAIIVLEDLHWADTASLALLEFIGHRLDGRQVLIIGTVRQIGSVAPTVSELTRARRLQSIELPPLGQRESNQLARHWRHGIPPSQLAELVQLCGGNPLFLTEMLRGAEPRATRVSDQELDDPPLPPLVETLVRARLAELSAGATRLVHLAAAFGRVMSVELLRRACEQADANLLDALLTEAHTHFVLERGPSKATPAEAVVWFRHDLMRQAVAAEITGPARATIHAAIGDALLELAGRDSERQAGQIAVHLLQAADRRRRDTGARYALMAGRQALAAYAFPEAVQHFTSITALQPTAEPELTARARFLRFQALMWHNMSRDVNAADTADLRAAFDWAAGHDRSLAQEIALVSWPGVFRTLDVERQLLELRTRAIQELELPATSRVWIETEIALARHALDVEPSAAGAALAKAEAVAVDLADRRLELHVIEGQQTMARRYLRWQDSVQLGQRAAALTRQLDDPFAESWALRQIGVDLYLDGDSAGAAATLQRLAAISQQIGDQSGVEYARWHLCVVEWQRGHWDTGRRHLSEGRSRFHDSAGHNLILASIALLTGDDETCEQRLASAHERASGDSPYSMAVHESVVAFADHVRDSAERRWEPASLAPTSGDDPGPPPAPLQQVRLKSARAGAAITAGSDQAAQAYESVAELVARNGRSLFTGISWQHLGALLSQACGQRERALRHYAAATSYAARAEAWPELALTLRDHARYRGGEAAVELAREGGQVARRVGMQLIARQCHEIAGGDLSRGSPRLTRRERDVLQVVASGASNDETATALGLSTKTVETHLGNIYRKLGASNRLQATELARQHQLLDDR